MKRIILLATFLIAALALIANKPAVEAPQIDWDLQVLDEFKAVRDAGWFDLDSTFHMAAVTDLTLMPSEATSFIQDYPDSVSAVSEVDVETDIVKNDSVYLGLNRWEDRVQILGLFQDYVTRINEAPDTVVELAHPIYFEDGKSYGEIDFESIKQKAQIEIELIKIVNRFAVVRAITRYRVEYPETGEVHWLENGDFASFGTNKVFFLAYEDERWSFYGNQIGNEDSESGNGGRGFLANGGSNLPGVGDDDNNGEDASAIDNVAGGVRGGGVLGGNVFDEMFLSNRSDYKVCDTILDKIKFCYVVLNIERGSDTMSFDMAGGLANDRFMMLHRRGAKVKLTKQTDGDWVPLPDAQVPWYRKLNAEVISASTQSSGPEIWHDEDHDLYDEQGELTKVGDAKIPKL